MKVLVTAGNTRVHIDQVRCLTNIFTGRTGAAIALEAHRRGHVATLLTSNPPGDLSDKRWRMSRYETFEELRKQMEEEITRGDYGAVIHSAAVSDYLVDGVFAPAPSTHFSKHRTWQEDISGVPAMLDRAAGKVKSDEPELWLRLVRAPKLIDRIRTDWGFKGVLVKFKLEVGIGETQLLEIAENSRVQSQADVMVANTLEGASSWVYLGAGAGGYVKIARHELPAKLLDAIDLLR